MSNIYKTGIILSNEFDESEAMDLITSKGTMTYVPAKDITNSCLNIANIIFDYTATETTSATVYRIIASVTYSGFDSSSTAGTFDLYWQGSRHNIADNTWVWSGGNQLCSALNSFKSLKTLVLSSASGSFIYDTTFTLPDDFRSTYNGFQIGFRANYSNGVGRITVNDIKIILDKYSSSSNVKSHIGNNYIAGKEFIEVY